jgi:hypothetical protein
MGNFAQDFRKIIINLKAIHKFDLKITINF